MTMQGMTTLKLRDSWGLNRSGRCVHFPCAGLIDTMHPWQVVGWTAACDPRPNLTECKTREVRGQLRRFDANKNHLIIKLQE